MLETRNLRKVYTPKKGVPVVALDSVSLKFPERGMVFLLGKSGSGKSTLLNLLGGLDKYDGGEIIIKGVSSRDFSQTRFDSYRNTYVGFIFQDYNILEEFTVGANIALALELQGKKATDAELNRILEEVDLVGYGNRKPNELSGGQLQRVAIARALVKNPEIIMADEPTGALDSATGKQVFDTLKKLSAEKLVIIVSHDREYAEFYADRIIELSDGRVKSDVEHTPEADGADDALSFDGDTITVPSGYHLTEEDRAEINAYIDRIKSGTRLHFSGLTKKFRDTDTSQIPPQDPSRFALIKSRLPMHSAFRIGASGLKYKKFRLFMTIMLSVVAFTLFALTDTFGAYDHIRTCTNSLLSSDIQYLSLVKSKKIVYNDLDFYWSRWGNKIEDSEIADIVKETGVPVKGVFVPSTGSLGFAEYMNNDTEIFTSGNYMIHSRAFSGFVEMTSSDLTSLGYDLTSGRLPDGTKNEIAITQYVAETFIKGGFATGETVEYEGGNVSPVYDKISKSSDLLGRKLNLAGTEYEIVGIVDTHFDMSRYARLTEDSEYNSTSDDIVDYVLWRELTYAQDYSFNCAAIVGEGMTAKLIEREPEEISASGVGGPYISINAMGDLVNSDLDIWVEYFGRLADIDAEVIWADGTPRTELAENEIVVCSSLINYYIWQDMGGGMMSGEYIEITPEDYDTVFGLSFVANIWGTGADGYFDDYYDNYRVVGIIDTSDSMVYAPDTRAVYLSEPVYEIMTANTDPGVYSFAVGAMPTSRGDLEEIVRYCYREDNDVRYEMQNPVTYELDSIHDVLVILARVFFWIGVGFAVFAAIMLANFIGTSIAYKKQEIGILRAIGSRSSDVFNIFFSEGFIIAMINFVIASAATAVITAVINYFVRAEAGILITILSFGLRQMALVLLISVGVAAVSCFLPVKKIASKRPIDAIRGR